MNLRPLRYPILILTASVALGAATAGPARAATSWPILRVYTVVVPPPLDHAFRQGIKLWETCLRTHGETHVQQAYDSETGDLNRYLFVVPYGSWAAMDQHGSAGKACDPTFNRSVLPNVSDAFSHIDHEKSKLSYLPGGDATLPSMIWVDYYRVKIGQWAHFTAAIRKYAAAAAKIHWQDHFQGLVTHATGPQGENFIFVWPNRNWADVGQQPKPSVKEMMDSVYGKAMAKMLGHEFNHSIASHWSAVWKYDKSLSYIPAK